VTTFSFMKIQRIDEKLEWLFQIEYNFDTSCSHHAYKMANFLLCEPITCGKLKGHSQNDVSWHLWCQFLFESESIERSLQISMC
jgi:hypothetical protein